MFLLAGAAVALPVFLHLLRRNPREPMGFPTLRFLKSVSVRETKRHRLRRLLVMLLRCLVLLLLAAAFARPYLPRFTTDTGRVVVIAIDNSMSMQVAGRWDRLRDWAIEQAGKGEPGDRIGLMMMNPQPSWLKNPNTDWDGTLLALRAMKPGFTSTRYAPPLALAAEMLSRMPAKKKELIWMADQQLAGWKGTDFSKKLPDGVSVKFPDPLPVPRHQAAINTAEWDNTPGSRGVTVSIRSYSAAPDVRKLTLLSGSRTIASRSVELTPGAVSRFALPAKDENVSSSLPLRIEMDPDDLPADDVAYLVRGESGKLSVMLDEMPSGKEKTDYLGIALESSLHHPTEPVSTASPPQNDWPVTSVAVLRNPDSFRNPALRNLDQFLNRGGRAMIFLDGSPAQRDWLRGKQVEIAGRDSVESLRDWAEEHTLIAPFAKRSLLPLLDLKFSKCWSLNGDSLIPLACWSDNSPGIAELSVGAGKVVLFGFEPARESTTWPLRPSFTPFLHHAVVTLGQTAAPAKSWKVGESIPLEGAGTWKTLDVQPPAPDREVNGSVKPMAPGIYEFLNDSKKDLFAVNIVPEESDLRPWTDGHPWLDMVSPRSKNVETDIMKPLAHEESERQLPLWWWLLAAAILTLLAEMALANRTSA
ncbi:MAG: hypothetical protein RLZZ408_135 [Verrucomicrobiota bacterium]|jgi:hypothetical protein